MFAVLGFELRAPLFGPDIDENRFVMEVGHAARAVSYNKGCFLGQEPIVMTRDRAGHVNRAFSGLKVLEGGPPASTLRPRNARLTCPARSRAITIGSWPRKQPLV